MYFSISHTIVGGAGIVILDYDDIISFEEIDESSLKCMKGVLWKNTPLNFVLNELREVYTLSTELRDHTYQSKPVRTFHITYPKLREILSVAFRDRVYQRSINDNALYPAMVRTFTNSNCACQIGRGTDYAINLLKEYLHRHYARYGQTGVIVQFDIHGYYKHMSHVLPKQVFRKKVKDTQTYNQIAHIIDSQYKSDIGFFPGSQMIQIAGISILSSLDHYIKETLGIKYYIRYMDDFLFIHHDPVYAEKCMLKILKFLKKLGFTANPHKTQIIPVRKGVKFLGFHFILTKTGKVKLHVLPQNISHRIHMLYTLSKKVRSGELTIYQFDESFTSWLAHIRRSPNSYKIFKIVQALYIRLRNRILSK